MTDDILQSDCEAIVNTVNCVGIMGKGLARQYRIKYPYMFLAYKAACEKTFFTPGAIQYYYDRPTHKTIYNFATKDHWRNPSQIEWIKTGLAKLKEYIRLDGIKSIAIPPLGCGNGGLNWDDVEPLIQEALGDMGIRVDIYPPNGPKYTLGEQK